MSEGTTRPEVSISELPEKQNKLTAFLGRLASFNLEQVAAVVVIIGATSSCVWWFANQHIEEELKAKDNVIAGKEAEIKSARLEEQQKSQGTIENLRQSLQDKTAELRPLQVRAALAPVPRDADLPSLDAAPRDKISLHDFLKRAASSDPYPYLQTSLQKTEFYGPYVGHRFEWAGFVDDIWKQGNDALALELRPIKGWRTFNGFADTVTCFFDRSESARVFAPLLKGQAVTVTGVMNSNGNLVKCKLLQVGDRPTRESLGIATTTEILILYEQ